MLQGIVLALSLVTLFFTDFCTEAQAAPFNYQGAYYFHSKVDVSVSKSNLLVRVANADGKKVLTDLQNDGYICKSQPQSFYTCSKFKKIDLSPATLERLRSKYTDFSIEFRTTAEDFTLVNDSNFLKEWEREQKIMIQSQPFYKLRHMEGSTYTKLQVIGADQKNSEWFNIVVKGQGFELRYPQYLSQKNSSDIKEIIDNTDTFLVELILEQ